MTEKLIKDCLLIGALAIGLVYAMKHKDTLYEMAGLTPPPSAQEQEIANSPVSPSSGQTGALKQISSGTVSISKSPDGQFWTQSRVNGAYVRFLIDTGASVVALAPIDARKAGIRLEALNYTHSVSTANGKTAAALVELKTVSVGTITLRDVKALIIKDGLSTSLLGMSYLGQLQKVEATPQTLILRL